MLKAHLDYIPLTASKFGCIGEIIFNSEQYYLGFIPKGFRWKGVLLNDGTHLQAKDFDLSDPIALILEQAKPIKEPDYHLNNYKPY